MTEPAWHTVRARAVRPLVDGVVELGLEVPGWPGHLAGQYVEIRRADDAPDVASHYFSIANPHHTGPSDLELAVGSDAFASVGPGERFLVRGPLGDGLVWDPECTGLRPLLLIGGGTGIVPLLSIARVWRHRLPRPHLQFIVSVRDLGHRLYTDELADLDAQPDAEVTTIVTRRDPMRPELRSGRLSALDLELHGIRPEDLPECFVCGPTGFVESVVRMLAQTRHPATSIHTEWDVTFDEEA